MSSIFPKVDPDGLLEYSVVYTDRAVNHMSQSLQQVMRDISSTLKKVYNAHSVAIVPGSGTFGMEAVARQFATDKKCLVIRNGWFSYRWTQIFEMGRIPSKEIVLMAQQTDASATAPFAPPTIEAVLATIEKEKPDVVFAPHVETSSGMILPNDYIQKVGEAIHAIGGLFILDCIASGAIWVDMEKSAVDVLISAPQKGWSGSPCAALVMMSEAAQEKLKDTVSTSFACDLAKWLWIMKAYENGGYAYHTTMPTNALVTFSHVMADAQNIGFDILHQRQQELGDRIRDLLTNNGIKSVAADGFDAPGVVVSYTNNPGIQNGSQFVEQGIQIAAGVPLMCNEPEGFSTFRLGLFGLDKLNNIDRTVTVFGEALDQILA